MSWSSQTRAVPVSAVRADLARGGRAPLSPGGSAPLLELIHHPLDPRLVGFATEVRVPPVEDHADAHPTIEKSGQKNTPELLIAQIPTSKPFTRTYTKR